MSMRVDSSTAHNILQRWDRDDTQELISDMSRELSRGAENGQFGRNDYDVDVVRSLAASMKDPIFWAKIEILLGYRFNI